MHTDKPAFPAYWHKNFALVCDRYVHECRECVSLSVIGTCTDVGSVWALTCSCMLVHANAFVCEFLHIHCCTHVLLPVTDCCTLRATCRRWTWRSTVFITSSSTSWRAPTTRKCRRSSKRSAHSVTVLIPTTNSTQSRGRSVKKSHSIVCTVSCSSNAWVFILGLDLLFDWSFIFYLFTICCPLSTFILYLLSSTWKSNCLHVTWLYFADTFAPIIHVY